MAYLFAIILKKYKLRILTSSFLIVFSSAVNLIGDLGLNTQQHWKEISILLSYIPISIVILLFIFSLIQIIIEKNPIDVIQKRVFYDAYYYTNNEYKFLIRQTLENKSKSTISELSGIKEGYLEKPKDVQIISNASDGYRIELFPQKNKKKRTHINGNSIDKVYVYEWHSDIKPALKANSEVKVNTMITAKGVEKDVFTQKGTSFSCRVFYNTIHLTITIHSPAGYFIKILDYSICDESGNSIKSIKYKAKHPKLVNGETMISWDIYFPQKNTRYGIRYKFQKL